ncbi:hypothetical protein Ccrd_020544 [Cynara cardunculus var. scolymus]|uniref:Uncharacterized protein n=1 Tax=Cynara cardunculus var. scolymus TaxID=59895 RepID=A0A103Y296_CYNCS|nr:hypothetical protein Ccrd_020544 [Cynara cardunculus var. scolymus]
MITPLTITIWRFQASDFVEVSIDHDDDEEPDAGKPNLRSRSLILVKVWCFLGLSLVVFLLTSSNGMRTLAAVVHHPTAVVVHRPTAAVVHHPTTAESPSDSSSLYINCGGKQFEDGKKVYEADVERGGASHFSSTGSRWGFSNTGHLLGNGRILPGSWWAHHELGRGGWWFRDPVENASFMSFGNDLK